MYVGQTMDFSIVILLALVYFVDAFEHGERCLYYNKECVPHCPRLMHPYHTRCDGKTMSQRTCSNPLIYVIGYTCGWSRCDCNGHLLLDDDSGFCVDIMNCPEPLSRRNKKRKNRVRKKPLAWRLPKKLSSQDSEDPLAKLIRD